MTRRIHVNNFVTTTTATINAAATSITLTSVTGLPGIGANEVYHFTVQQGVKREIMIAADDASSPSFTVTRAAEGTTAQAFTAGASVQIRVTADSLNRKQDAVATAGDVIDFGAAESFEIPNSAAPTVDAAGEMALDVTITDHKPLIKYYTGAEEMVVIAVPTPQLTATDNQVLEYDAANDRFQFVTPAGGVSDGDYGEVVVSSSGTVWTLDDNLVFHGTNGNVLAQGSTASRPAAGTFGRVRPNTSTGYIEFDNGADWLPLPTAPNGTITANSVPTWSATNTPNLQNNSGVTIASNIITCSGINLGETTLDYYEEGTWTPVWTFSTMGDLSVSYSSQVGIFRRIGKLNYLSIIMTATPTYTTASGALEITGMPFNSSSTTIGTPCVEGANCTWTAGRTTAVIRCNTSGVINVAGMGSAAAVTNFNVTNFPTTLVQTIRGNLSYPVS